MTTRDGFKVEGIYQGKGFCYCDAGGGRYGLADWILHQMAGQGTDRVRPIVPEFAGIMSVIVKVQRRT